MAIIDVGAAAIDRASNFGSGLSGITLVALDNPANTFGTITVIEFWTPYGTVGTRVGTFYFVSGTDYKCRASITIGDMSAGYHKFTGLSLDVEAGDYVGCHLPSAGGTIEADTTGYAGVYRIEGEYIDPGDQATYTLYSGYAISLYGTGIGVKRVLANSRLLAALRVLPSVRELTPVR